MATFREMLVAVGNGISRDKLTDMFELYDIPASERDLCKKPLDVLVLLRDKGKFSAKNTTPLRQLLEKIECSKLVAKVDHYDASRGVPPVFSGPPAGSAAPSSAPAPAAVSVPVPVPEPAPVSAAAAPSAVGRPQGPVDEAAFVDEVVKAIVLTADEKAAVERIVAAIPDLLKQANIPLAPGYKVIHSGSTKRGTAVTPLHDVDVMVPVPEQWVGGRRPAKFIDYAAGKVAKVAQVNRPQRRSFQVELLGHKVDIVPVVPRGDAFDIPVVEPEHGQPEWQATNPDEHFTVFLKADFETGRNLTKAILIAKRWNKCRNEHLRASSFLLEERLCAIKEKLRQESWKDILVSVFDCIYTDAYLFNLAEHATNMLEDDAKEARDLLQSTGVTALRTLLKLP